MINVMDEETMSDNDIIAEVKQRYQGLCLDLNLDQTTADEAWSNYENINVKYTLEASILLVGLA